MLRTMASLLGRSERGLSQGGSRCGVCGFINRHVEGEEPGAGPLEQRIDGSQQLGCQPRWRSHRAATAASPVTGLNSQDPNRLPRPARSDSPDSGVLHQQSGAGWRRTFPDTTQ